MSATTTTETGVESHEQVQERRFNHHPSFYRRGYLETQTIPVSFERRDNTYEGEVEISAKYDVVRGRQKPTGKKCYGTQREVCNAWLEMVFPAHNFTAPKTYGDEEPRWQDGEATLYTWSARRIGGWWSRGSSEQVINFEGIQYPDGSGELIHYDTTAAIRTKNGLIINNQQNWATGFATQTEPLNHERDYVLPLDGIEQLLESGEEIFDIVDVIADNERFVESWNGRKHRHVPTDEPKLVLLASGDAICVGRDSTASDYNQSFFGFRVEDEELASLRSAQEAIELLKPDFIAAMEQKGLPIYERDGKTDGNRIVRQGEWFLVPVEDDFDDSSLRVEKILADAYRKRKTTKWEDGERKTEYVRRLNRTFTDSDLGSHIPRDKATELPTECGECGGSSFEMDEQGQVDCEDCGHEFSTIYVRGTFRHIRGEHGIVNLGERWHKAITHDRDVMVFDTGNGTGSGGWD